MVFRDSEWDTVRLGTFGDEPALSELSNRISDFGNGDGRISEGIRTIQVIIRGRITHR